MEPAPEGPLVKPKRPMTEAQLDALKRGRAKLAEKRRQIKEGEESQSVQSSEPVKEEPSEGIVVDDSSESEPNPEDDTEEHAYCSVM